MKHVDKKLLSIAAAGLSAWLLVIALVAFDSTTTAMLTNEPTPSEQTQPKNDESQPRTLGATSDATTLRATNESSTPDTGEITSAHLMQAPASNFAQNSPDLSSEVDAAATSKPSKTVLLMSIASAILLVAGTTLWIFTSKSKPTEKQ